MKKLRTSYRVWKCLLFSILTFGIYNLYILHRFAKDTNIACAEDGKKTRGLLALILLSFIAFGIYGIVWNAMLVFRKGIFCEKNNVPNRLSLTFYLLTVFFLGVLTLYICLFIVFFKFIHQQNDVNKIYNSKLTA